MSQRGVERIIGRLVTDEEFRRRFVLDPGSTLREATCCSLELTKIEVQALVAIEPRILERLAEALDPRLQKICVEGGLP
jgi:ribosomally synthesized peptide